MNKLILPPRWNTVLSGGAINLYDRLHIKGTIKQLAPTSFHAKANLYSQPVAFADGPHKMMMLPRRTEQDLGFFDTAQECVDAILAAQIAHKVEGEP